MDLNGKIFAMINRIKSTQERNYFEDNCECDNETSWICYLFSWAFDLEFRFTNIIIYVARMEEGGSAFKILAGKTYWKETFREAQA